MSTNNKTKKKYYETSNFEELQAQWYERVEGSTGSDGTTYTDIEKSEDGYK
jgi:hypothetical protein